MPRTLPLLALVAVVALAGCLGGLGLGGRSDDATTTTTPISTETTQTPTSTPAATMTETTTRTTTQTPSTTTQATTQATTRVTTIPTRTTARVDAPNGSDRFEARVMKIVDPTTVKIEHDGKTQTVDLIGAKVPKNGTIHTRALQMTTAQLQHGVVTVVTDPKVEDDSDGHLQAYVYTGDWLYNTLLIQSGYARVTDGEFSKRAEFEQKQQAAKHGGYGLWKNATTA
jgi:endonuclease YncB( thermonuclease family)